MTMKIVRRAHVGKFMDGRLQARKDNPERREFKCWDVVNENGDFITGGLLKVSWTSDKPMFATKAEAQEWIDDSRISRAVPQ